MAEEVFTAGDDNSNPFSDESTADFARDDADDDVPGVEDEEVQEDLLVDDDESDESDDVSEVEDVDLPERQPAHEYLFDATLAAGKMPNQSMVRYDDGGWEYDEENPAPFDEAPDWMEELSFDVITTAGHEHMRIAYEYGFKTGGRLDNIDRLAVDGIPIHFIDMDWHNPEFDRLVEAAKKYEPEYIVGGDYTKHDPSHPDSNISLINERAEKLAQFSENVIVVPHGSNQVDHVPEWAVVGYSVPTTYGAAEGELIDYHGRDMHLLGGAPAKQMDMIREFGEDIVSIDGNAINKMANVANRYWSGHDWKFENPSLDVMGEPEDSDLYQSGAFPRSRDVAGSHLVDPDIVSNRNFEAYERSVMHWALQIRTRWENGWFNGESDNVLEF
ncbi:hypothetical protein HVTV-2_gp68 [Haloarcula virus HVTV-2]|uniref:Uncharacterized protein n=1 Tax=Haloarcula vallismortis tailed virus 1 TaxID=1262528 RepID=L7TJ73_9CAUD|nr:hypothetical protein HVTV1_69 [Haloarcula vallismortis tailed virus 1]AGC34438.1 hypothetical protein HVTV1_69 [Haloarcula vallismortis tailed virus 1]UBF22875.1 hypothetical protein HVTV-2_gp68 [Haloarcula virus HVTV-2]